MIKLFTKYAIGFFLMTFAVSCAQQGTEQQQTQETVTDTVEVTTDYTEAVAVVHPTEENSASGTVTFSQTNDGVRVEAEIEGLEEGNHGFHIHQYGDCTASDGTSAGGHYNPEGNDHAGPDAESRHVGDMGNIEANADGIATKSYVDSTIELNGSNSIIGRGIVIHGGEDDLESQPTGDAGPRMGCGVIGIANTSN